MTVAISIAGEGIKSLSRRCVGLAVAAAAAMLLSGCIAPSLYVGNNLPAVAVADLKQPANRTPVQILVEYQSNGATKATATEKVIPIVSDLMKQSNLFSDVVVAPASADRKLFLKFNDVGDVNEAAAKGFATGFTFGLVGNTVSAGIVLDATYIVPGRQERAHTYRTVLYTSIGATASPPPGLTKAPSLKEGEHQFLSNLIMNLLNDMSHDGELE